MGKGKGKREKVQVADKKHPGKYSTRQRRQVWETLLESGGNHLSAAELHHRLLEKGERIGKATVYRTLNKLTAEGIVTKYIAEKGMSACFVCRIRPECAEHTHLKCIACGALVHLDCERIEPFFLHINKAHRFRIDPSKTVFYGLCDACAGKDKKTGDLLKSIAEGV